MKIPDISEEMPTPIPSVNIGNKFQWKAKLGLKKSFSSHFNSSSSWRFELADELYDLKQNSKNLEITDEIEQSTSSLLYVSKRTPRSIENNESRAKRLQGFYWAP